MGYSRDVHEFVFKKYNSKTIVNKYEELFDLCITN